MSKARSCFSMLLSLLAASAGLRAEDPNRSIEVAGGSGGIGFDDLRYAPSLERILIPAGRMGILVLLDPVTRALETVAGFSSTERYGGGHGEGITSVDYGKGLLYAIDRSSLQLDVVDPFAKKIVSRAALGAGPDYVRYVASSHEAWVTEPDAEQIEVFRLGATRDPPARSAAIPVKGGPESLVVDGLGGRAYTHLWSGKTVVIDTRTRQRVAEWNNGCAGSRGIALDAPRKHLFVGCAEGRAVVLSTETGKMLSSTASGDGVDIIDYDPKRSHLYVPGGKSATLAILAVSAEGRLTLVRSVPTVPGAHCAVADGAGRVYVCDPTRGRLLVIEDRP